MTKPATSTSRWLERGLFAVSLALVLLNLAQKDAGESRQVTQGAETRAAVELQGSEAVASGARLRPEAQDAETRLVMEQALDTGWLETLDDARLVRVEQPDGQQLVYEGAGWVSSSLAGRRSWEGIYRHDGLSYNLIITRGLRSTYGSVSTPAGNYELQPGEQGLEFVRKQPRRSGQDDLDPEGA